MAKAKGRRQKPAPQRTCIICRQTQAKRALVRIVRTSDGGVQIDPTGKLAGRGAYLCRTQTCWNTALTSSRLSAALKATLTSDELAALQGFAAGLPEIPDVAPLREAHASGEISPS
jgi:predicted RNA-binding protein YlxR (DUF448 family)